MRNSIYTNSCQEASKCIGPYVDFIPNPDSLGDIEGEAVVEFRIANPSLLLTFHKAVPNADGSFPDDNATLAVSIGAVGYHGDICVEPHHLCQE